MKVIIDVEEYRDIENGYHYKVRNFNGNTYSIPKVICQPLDDNIRLTEEQANKLSEEYTDFRINRYSSDRFTECNLYYFLKEKGWIKKWDY